MADKTYSCHELSAIRRTQPSQHILLGVLVKQGQTICLVPLEGYGEHPFVKRIQEVCAEAQKARKVKAYWDKCGLGSRMLHPALEVGPHCLDLKYASLDKAKEAVAGGLQSLAPPEPEPEPDKPKKAKPVKEDHESIVPPEPIELEVFPEFLAGGE